MTEYKFGTWYPIETVPKNEDVIIYTKEDIISIGEACFKTEDSDYHEIDVLYHLEQLNDEKKPPTALFWMPLPPMPESEASND